MYLCLTMEDSEEMSVCRQKYCYIMYACSVHDACMFSVDLWASKILRLVHRSKPGTTKNDCSLRSMSLDGLTTYDTHEIANLGLQTDMIDKRCSMQLNNRNESARTEAEHEVLTGRVRVLW